MKTYSLFLLLLLFAAGCHTTKNTNNGNTPLPKEQTEPRDARITTDKIDSDKAIVGGQASDENGGVAFAKVVLKQGDKVLFGVETDFDGYFMIKDVPAGKYVLQAQYVGYQPVLISLNVEAGTAYKVKAYFAAEVFLEKPVIYLYPTQKQEISVRLQYDGVLTHTYPKYPADGWRVTAAPDGTLWDAKGMEYYALFWEGVPRKPLPVSDGFIVAGEDVEAFLEEKLAYLGLNRREANEFIMYWLPRMEGNKYNFIHFSHSAYDDLAKLHIEPQPETIIRLMMLTQPLKTKIKFPTQDLTPLKKTRKGFAVVEWGGSVIDYIKEGL